MADDTENKVEDMKEEEKQPPVMEHKEFGGSIGCLLTYVSTPALFIFMAYFYHNLGSDYSKFSRNQFNADVMSALANCTLWKVQITYTVLVAAIFALPAPKIIEGPATPSGEKLKYKIAAIPTLLIFLSIFAYFFLYDEQEELLPISTFLKLYYFQLVIQSTVIAFLWQLAFIVRSYYLSPSQRNPIATSGNVIYDSFLGYELHPRVGELFDLKIFLYRYAMVQWVLFSLFKFTEVYRGAGGGYEALKANPEVVIMCLTHIAYCYSVYFGDEESCPYMFDIKYDGLGFQQTFGEIVIVPFIYSLPIQLVIDFPDHQHAYTVRVIAATVLLVVGIVLAGLSNGQKTKFRTSDWRTYSSGDVISADDGVLLCGGCWGLSRHPNYLAEVLIAIGWSLLCGFTHYFMWFYPLFVIPLVITRAERLENTSHKKGSKVWSLYTEKVPYKIVPYLY